MKLISLNLEGKRQLDTALPWLEKETADIICLMEAPEDLQPWLAERGYITTFAPMTFRKQDGQQFYEGLILASKAVHTADIFYYHQPSTDIIPHDRKEKRNTISHPVIFASIGNLHIATTHFTWNPAGETADENQTTDLVKLLKYLHSKPSHILCGDLNIPRHYNILYEELIKHYTDVVPQQYRSSLDKKLHRLGDNPDKQKLFTHFMVDYIFTQPPFAATDVQLQFNLSDHAAVIAEITPLSRS